jgi:hypothetical protein
MAKTTIPKDFATLEGATARICSRCPGVYVKHLRWNVTMLLVDNWDIQSKKRVSDFCRSWADRYKAAMLERQSLLQVIKAQKGSAKAHLGQFVNQVHEELYYSATEYKLASAVYMSFALNPEALREEDDFNGALIHAMTNAFDKEIISFIPKEKREKIPAWSAKQIITTLEELGHVGKANALRKAINAMGRRLELLMKDVGKEFEVNFNVIGTDIDFRNKELRNFLKSKDIPNKLKLDTMLAEYLGTKEAFMDANALYSKSRNLPTAANEKIVQDMKDNVYRMKVREARKTAEKFGAGMKKKKVEEESAKGKGKIKSSKNIRRDEKRKEEQHERLTENREERIVPKKKKKKKPKEIAPDEEFSGEEEEDQVPQLVPMVDETEADTTLEETKKDMVEAIQVMVTQAISHAEAVQENEDEVDEEWNWDIIKGDLSSDVTIDKSLDFDAFE